MKRILIPSMLLSVVALGAVAEAATGAPPRRRVHRRPAPPPLLWHVETLDGQVLDTAGSDEVINPASVTKVATTWWALERLGAEHRFETRFRAAGRLEHAARALRGDLLVEGTGDPDFQSENAFMVALRLNELGLGRVTGKLVVNDRFWMGWEGGSDRATMDAQRRGLLMAARLQRALEPRLWDRWTRASWHAFAARRGMDPQRPPIVRVDGGLDVRGDVAGDLLLTHRSKPLADTLRRFNCYSNNDIERIGAVLGPVEELGRLLTERLEAPDGAIRFETTSGLGENRMTPRLIVHLLRRFRESVQQMGLGVERLLPVAGCDPGTVTHMYPQLARLPNATSVVAKTGTLTSTDGGVSILAGFASTAAGELAFCVAAPNSAGRLRVARRGEERFVLDLLERNGGPQPRTCAEPLPLSDAGAEVVPSQAVASSALAPTTVSVSPAR